jgi:hypothetical protein
MDFPDYVPDGARRFAENFLKSSPVFRTEGYETLLTKARAELDQIDRVIRNQSKRPGDRAQREAPEAGEAKQNELRQRRKEKDDAARQLELDVAVIRRLVYDERMEDVYRLLSEIFSGQTDRDSKINQFLSAAWGARIEYAKYRERMKRAKELTAEIASTASKLSDLLRRIGEYLPLEFYRVDQLLRQTDNMELNGKDLYSWRLMRGLVLGDPPGRLEPVTEANPPEVTIPVRKLDEQRDIDPAERARNTTRYAWGLSPPVAALLETLANVARHWEPAEAGFIAAAVGKRQHNQKTEYLRAFAHLLTDGHQFTLASPIMHAMAATANVVINDDDIDTSYDDVRKAVGTN